MSRDDEGHLWFHYAGVVLYVVAVAYLVFQMNATP